MLREIANGPALAVFVLELACYSENAKNEDEFLDRISSHHYSKLHSVDSIPEVLVLLSRLLLELGHRAEGAGILNPLVAHLSRETTSESYGSVLREAVWVLSRAVL
jgi:hypothetical protein